VSCPSHAPSASSAAQRAAQRQLEVALARIELKLGGLEAKLNALATRLTHLHTPTLLVGHAEITRYCRKRPATIQRYVRTMGFPAYRWGRHTVSSLSFLRPGGFFGVFCIEPPVHDCDGRLMAMPARVVL